MQKVLRRPERGERTVSICVCPTVAAGKKWWSRGALSEKKGGEGVATRHSSEEEGHKKHPSTPPVVGVGHEKPRSLEI